MVTIKTGNAYFKILWHLRKHHSVKLPSVTCIHIVTFKLIEHGLALWVLNTSHDWLILVWLFADISGI